MTNQAPPTPDPATIEQAARKDNAVAYKDASYVVACRELIDDTERNWLPTREMYRDLLVVTEQYLDALRSRSDLRGALERVRDIAEDSRDNGYTREALILRFAEIGQIVDQYLATPITTDEEGLG